MNRYLSRKNFLLNLMTAFSLLIFVFFISHIFFGDRSVWKIFSLNNQISLAKNEFNILFNDKIKISSEINLLRDGNLDPDIISEIAHKLLGLIDSDQIVIDITK